MEPAHHVDPLEEALSHGSQRVAQVASLAAAMAQVVMQHKALDDARSAVMGGQDGAQVLSEQEHALHQQARLGWAPAHDPQWLAHSGLGEAARTWAAAAAYADTDPTAASALRKCEDRLRALHPYAMARYTRLRDEGMSPLDAMRQAAPLFARAPTVRTGDRAPERPVLGAGTGRDSPLPTNAVASGTMDPEATADSDTPAKARGQQIVDRLQSRARATGHPELGADELAMILEATTNLPPDVIERITRQPAIQTHARNGQQRSAVQLAAQSFPYSATEAVRAAKTRTGNLETKTATRAPVPRAKEPGGPSRYQLGGPQ